MVVIIRSRLARLRSPTGDEDRVKLVILASAIHDCNVVLLLQNTSWNKIFQELIIISTQSHPQFASVSSGTATMDPPTSLRIIESATGFGRMNQRTDFFT